MPPLRRLAMRALKTCLVLLAALVLVLLLAQHRLIYPSPRYRAGFRERLPQQAAELHYQTSEGAQSAFYVAPRIPGDASPDRVWIIFPGNASLALNYLPFIANAPRLSDAFLLLDYPGYGANKGSASPESIQVSATTALSALAAHLKQPLDTLVPKLGLIGHSIGCATALQFGVHYPVDRVVLIAPFTTLREVCQRRVGLPLSYLLLHDYDNRARLAELASRAPAPKVSIVHGSSDFTIPSKMGRELGALHPAMIEFHEIPRAGHGSILQRGIEQIYDAMR